MQDLLAYFHKQLTIYRIIKILGIYQVTGFFTATIHFFHATLMMGLIRPLSIPPNSNQLNLMEVIIS
jgi:hypothetical protein